jgi:DNA-binding response OmpR family regulator
VIFNVSYHFHEIYGKTNICGKTTGCVLSKGKKVANIVIFDDDTDLVDVLTTFLNKAGHHVYSALDGESGLELLKSTAADILITDICMPQKSGHEAILEIRQETPELKILAMTGGGIATSADMYCQVASKVGADKTLMKPFDPQEFLHTVHSLL